MTGIDRRTAIRLAMASALATQFSGRALAAQDFGGGSLIAPPEGSMVYRRSIARELVNGDFMRCTRTFTVEFGAVREGYLLSGAQTGVEVDAPPSLASFAELEEQRDESALFPIALDAFGQIQSPAGDPLNPDAVAAAVQQSISALGRQAIPGAEREALQQFISAFHAAGQRVTAVLPPDLFAPTRVPRRTAQEIVLPDGATGEVESLFEGSLDGATGLMVSASRQIVTRVDESRRTTMESWSLQPA